MVNVCRFCNNCKREEDENGFGTVYCKVLSKRGEDSWITNDQSFIGFVTGGIDLSDECNGSFAWNCDVEQIVRTLKWLSDRYEELHDSEIKLMVVRKGNTADAARIIEESDE